MKINEFVKLNINYVIAEYPFMADYFSDNDNLYTDFDKSPFEILNSISEEDLEDIAIDKQLTFNNYFEFFKQMKEFLGIEDDRVDSLTILKGHDKKGNPEAYDLTIKVGEVIAIVGPTGSGKSRLLADIEWIADKDTPTQRKILINEKEADKKWRFSSGNKIVAQLSQNMNFVMDLSVKEFLELHANSRLVDDVDNIVDKIIIEANLLAGESFDLDTPITSLSGGQSRALMIADTAILSKSPIVLIDEIENAGIDRKKALALLVKEEKIVLMATHDPILALMADKRIVIKNGGINKILQTSDEEKEMLGKLEQIDKFLMKQRQLIRLGKVVKLESFYTQ
jgi:ABC-type lipoprotein export system ATPase subunit